MRRLRPLTVATVVAGFVAGAIGGAIALHPGSAPASPSGSGPAFHQPVPAQFRAALSQMRASNIQTTIDKLVSFGTRQTLSSQTDPNRGIGAARDYIFHTLQGYAAASGGRMTVQEQPFIQPASKDPDARMPHATQLTNIVATLNGDQPQSVKRVYVVSGHYDSRCTGPIDAKCDAPGADDDGSGVAAMMEMARVMATQHFDATIKFITVPGEEEDLYGSAHFAKVAKQQHMNIEGMLNNDIIGSDTGPNGEKAPFTIRLFSEGIPTVLNSDNESNLQNVGGESDSPARELARYVSEVADNSATGMHVEQVFRRDRYLRGGDQISFLQNGYPAVRFTEPIENFDHEHQTPRVVKGVQFGDLAKFMDFGFNDRVAKVNALTLMNLADAPATPVNARIIASTLTNDTTLKWDANTEPDLKGYEVVWRDTTDPFWTHVIPVGNRTTYTAKGLSKDNVYFGVRAIDKSGFRSPVAFPVPATK
jgi:Zn-dependent M28 family amino/carboxypeptidase